VAIERAVGEQRQAFAGELVDTVSTRNQRPSASLALMKSMLHFWLGRVALGIGTRERRASFLRSLVHTLSLSSV
jgi:hypothetical protein